MEIDYSPTDSIGRTNKMNGCAFKYMCQIKLV